MSAQSKQANGCIAGSESKGRQADLCLREYGRTGRSPAERFRADGPIAISESTGRQADHRMREYRLTVGQADRLLRE